MPNSETVASIKPDLSLKEPPLFSIIYMNDDVTSFEFVMNSLMKFFNYNYDTAQDLTKKIHEEGYGVVAVLPYELAEQLGGDVTLEARNNGFPLTIKVEPTS